jgi:hypothetical protein
MCFYENITGITWSTRGYKFAEFSPQTQQMKKVFLSFALITISALTAGADTSTKEVKSFIYDWIISPEAIEYAGGDFTFDVQHTDDPDPRVKNTFYIVIHEPSNYRFQHPKSLLRALAGALILKFHGHFYLEEDALRKVRYGAYEADPNTMAELPSDGLPIVVFDIPLNED